MKLKKALTCLLVAVLCVGAFTGCLKEKQSESVSTENIMETVEALTEAEPPIAEPEQKDNPSKKNYKTVAISDWGYESIEYVNSKYLMAYKDNKWILVSAFSGEKTEWPFKYGDDQYEAEFDTVYMNLQDGCFIGVIAEDDGTFTSALFDPNEEVIRFKLHKNQGNLVDYRDNLIIAETKGKDDTDYYYIISIKDGEYAYTAYKKAKLPFLRSSYGIFNLSFNTFYTDIKTCGWRFNSYDVRDYIDDKSEDKGKLLEYAESVNNSYEDKAVQVWPNTTNKEGWVRASVFDVDYDRYGSPRFLGDTGKAGFYNLLTQEFTETPGESASCSYFTTENGSDKCTVSDSRAAVSVEVSDDSVSEDEKKTAYRIYDLRVGNWANEDLYTGVKAFGYHKYVLVQSIDGGVGYIRDDNMTHEGEWFDDASSFCNGYAITVKDGKACLIDENLETVSEEFDAKLVTAVIDYYEFLDLEGKSVFFVQQSDGLFHMVTIN